MGAWVVRNGEWFLCQGPDWAVSTWTTDAVEATRYATRDEAREVVREAKEQGHRPFGRPPQCASAVKAP